MKQIVKTAVNFVRGIIDAILTIKLCMALIGMCCLYKALPEDNTIKKIGNAIFYSIGPYHPIQMVKAKEDIKRNYHTARQLVANRNDVEAGITAKSGDEEQGIKEKSR